MATSKKTALVISGGASKAAFAVGESDTGITGVDADGVALAAIQGLNEKVEVRSQRSEASIQKLEAENAELKARLERLDCDLLCLRDQQGHSPAYPGPPP